jgi:IS30 family transposase
VVAALSQHVRKLPATLRRSLTWDRGLEMAKHKIPSKYRSAVPRQYPVLAR